MDQIQEQLREEQRRKQTEALSSGQTATGLSARDIAFQDQIRAQALQNAGAIDASTFAPSTESVLETKDALRSSLVEGQVASLEAQAARQQELSRRGTQQAATAANAFGGSRQGIAEATRAAEIDRALAQETARIRSEADAAALSAAIPLASQQALSPFSFARGQGALLQSALGPTGTVQQKHAQSLTNVDDLLRSLGIAREQEAKLSAGVGTSQEERDSLRRKQERGNFLGGLVGLAGSILPLIPGIGGAAGGLLGSLFD